MIRSCLVLIMGRVAVTNSKHILGFRHIWWGFPSIKPECCIDCTVVCTRDQQRLALFEDQTVGDHISYNNITTKLAKAEFPHNIDLINDS